MRFELGGEAEETQESMASLGRAFLVAIIGIYFILILLFNKLTQPLMVMTAIPFGIAGVIFAFALHGESLGFVATMGIIGLAGVVVNDSLVLVNHINRLQAQMPAEDIKKVVDPTANMGAVKRTIARRFTKPKNYHINCTYEFKLKTEAGIREIKGTDKFRYNYVNP